jgi:histone deacetylase complex regulatory component SIN3
MFKLNTFKLFGKCYKKEENLSENLKMSGKDNFTNCVLQNHLCGD